MEALLLVDPEAEQETMVYGLGTLKLLASCPELREQLASSTQVMSLLLNTLKLCIQPGRNVNILIQVERAAQCCTALHCTGTSSGCNSECIEYLVEYGLQCFR